MPRRGRRVGEALALSAALLLAACSPAGQFSQASSDGAAAAQSGALALRLAAEGKTIPGLVTTALEDSMKELQKQDKALTSGETSGKVGRLRDETLRRVREAEDQILLAQSMIEERDPAGLEPAADRLASTADELRGLGKQLESLQ